MISNYKRYEKTREKKEQERKEWRRDGKVKEGLRKGNINEEAYHEWDEKCEKYLSWYIKEGEKGHIVTKHYWKSAKKKKLSKKLER